MQGAAQAGRIRGFDGLRAFAVLLVFFQHETTFGETYSLGGYGVWLFFVLSGFLIVRILVDQRRAIEAGTMRRRPALARFYWRRTLRTAPPYYMALAVFTVLGAAGLAWDFPLSSAGWYYAHLSNLYFILIGHFVGRLSHVWSLAVEEQFYLVAAPLLLLAVPSRMARKACAWVFLAGVTFDVILRTGGASAVAIYINPITNFGALAFGGWVGLGLTAKARTDGRSSWPVLLCLAVAAGWFFGFQHIGSYPDDVATLIAAAPLWATTLTGGALLYGLYRNQASRVTAVLEWAPIAGFGRISYGFYLYHNLLPQDLVGRLVHLAGERWQVPEAAEAAMVFVLALALATASWRLVEQPLLRLKDSPPRLAWLRRGAASPLAGE